MVVRNFIIVKCFPIELSCVYIPVNLTPAFRVMLTPTFR